MIRCKQKGPHQQVRFWLSLSVLPTARGLLALPALPTALHPELTQAGPRPWHHPSAYSVNPVKDSHRPFWSDPQLEALAPLPWELTAPSFSVL